MASLETISCPLVWGDVKNCCPQPLALGKSLLWFLPTPRDNSLIVALEAME